jgi:hypothetical protein
MVEKTWKETGNKRLITLDEAIMFLAKPNHHEEEVIRRKLQKGATLQTPVAYYRMVKKPK